MSEQIDIEQVFDQYTNFRKLVGEFFECDAVWYNVILHLDEKWTDYNEQHDSIGFDLQEDEFMYSFDVVGTSRWEKGDFVMFCGNDCCGNRDLYVFKLSNKMEK